MFKHIGNLILNVTAIIFIVCLLYSLSVGPMLANYRECGTIFFCKNQH